MVMLLPSLHVTTTSAKGIGWPLRSATRTVTTRIVSTRGRARTSCPRSLRLT